MNKIKLFSILLVIHLFVTGLYAYSDSVLSGAKLFQGTKKFKNGGVACIACHNVKNDLVQKGGMLALDLTSMGAAGIEYTIQDPNNASSDVMKNAFKNKSLTKEEQADLLSFFDSAASSNQENISNNFVISGILGAIIIFLILSFLARNRKKESVNQKIYDRQIKSSWKEAK